MSDTFCCGESCVNCGGFGCNGSDSSARYREQRLNKEIIRLRALIGEPPEGSHPDEALPRSVTWHKERQNWISEVDQLRGHINKLENEAKTYKAFVHENAATVGPCEDHGESCLPHISVEVIRLKARVDTLQDKLVAAVQDVAATTNKR